ncbi:MAG: M15 family metallopeptidase [Bacteroidia bacterium]
MTILAGVSVLLLFSCSNPFAERTSESIGKDSVILSDTLKQVDSIAGWSQIDFEKLGIIAKMAYADTANFMHEKIYPCAKCFLRPEAAAALIKAADIAKKQNLRLVIYDCYRPRVYQQKMYDIVQNPDYVAAPGNGSKHNRGLAVDIALADASGVLLDFGCAFDDFSEKAHYTYQGISEQAKSNRKKLRDIMVEAGFEPYKNEWWHFNYSTVSYPSDDFLWNCN